jgi:3',5'-cyclic AMP phosphodiesterase CpdA
MTDETRLHAGPSVFPVPDPPGEARSGRETPVNGNGAVTGIGNVPTKTRTGRPCETLCEAFLAQTFPYVEAVYADAFCLTGSPEDAADLVEAAYVRAFQEYKRFLQRRVPAHQRSCTVRAWLFRNLHAAFCDVVLAQAGPPDMPIGD